MAGSFGFEAFALEGKGNRVGDGLVGGTVGFDRLVGAGMVDTSLFGAS